jgi:hypothetical protein
MNIISMSRKLRIEVIALLSFLWLISYTFADEASGVTASSWESRRYLIEGVYYLINEGDLDVAEGLFRKAILSSPFSSLSMEVGDQGYDRQVVAEAFYFLGRIHYERAILGTGKENHEKSIENIASAKSYLGRAEKYGIVHDRLHPPLLDQINRKYPEISMPNLEANPDKAIVAIETEHGGSYKVNAVKVDQYTDVTDNRFLTNREFYLECGARYKVEPDIQGGYKSIHRALTVLGIALVVWLTRD